MSGRYYDTDLGALTAKMQKLSGKKPKRAAASQAPVTSIAKVKSARSRKNSRTKGNNYELRIAKRFAAWSGEVVRRTPMSGGWSSAKFGVTGDLVCDNPAFDLHVECKKREGWHLDDLLTGIRPDDSRSIEAWWKQTVESCPEGKMAVLVFARNQGPDLVMMIHGDLVGLGPELAYAASSYPTLVLGARILLTLDAFLAVVRPPKGCKNHKSWRPA